MFYPSLHYGMWGSALLHILFNFIYCRLSMNIWKRGLIKRQDRFSIYTILINIVCPLKPQILFFCAIKLQCCPKDIKNTWLSLTCCARVYYEHGSCSLFWVNPIYIILLLNKMQIKEQACSNLQAENSPTSSVCYPVWLTNGKTKKKHFLGENGVLNMICFYRK